MDLALSFIVAVAAGVVCHYIIKWLDGKSYPDLQILVSMSNQFSSHPVLFKIK